MLRVPIITRFRRRNVNIVCFLAFKNAYFYTVGAEFSFFTTLSVKEWKFLHGHHFVRERMEIFTRSE